MVSFMNIRTVLGLYIIPGKIKIAKQALKSKQHSNDLFNCLTFSMNIKNKTTQAKLLPDVPVAEHSPLQGASLKTEAPQYKPGK